MKYSPIVKELFYRLNRDFYTDKLWPGKMCQVKNGMPTVAMWVQAAIVCVLIFLVSFGGKEGLSFFRD
jgi:amino acid transporter